MPERPVYPGVYVQELPGNVRAISGVATSISAFVGFTARGEDHRARNVKSFGKFERIFGGLAADSELSYAISHYFLNGGREAVVVRVPKSDATAAVGTAGPLTFRALGKGAWGNEVVVAVDDRGGQTIDVTIRYPAAGIEERFPGVTLEAGDPRFVEKVVNDPERGSQLVSVKAGGREAARAGADGTLLPTAAELIGSAADFTGIYALEKVDTFNLLTIPDATRAASGRPETLDARVEPNAIYRAAMALCRKRRAFLLVDPPPDVNTVEAAAQWKAAGLAVREANAAAYFPRLRMPDQLKGSQLRTFAPSGVIAGLMARTDTERGVWKAAAGVNATLKGVRELSCKLTDAENGRLNSLGLNCFRTFPTVGVVCWGSRTLAGGDAGASEWKYVPVRRLALYLEESLYRGTQWAVFEPNDERLWAQIRMLVSNFLGNLFRQGAFAGASESEANSVKCDATTTTQADIQQGILNIQVMFAPLHPGEFVVLWIQQRSGA
jgi:phage tail sheath protein FI